MPMTSPPTKQAVKVENSEPKAGTKLKVREERLVAVSACKVCFGNAGVTTPVGDTVCMRLIRTLQAYEESSTATVTDARQFTATVRFVLAFNESAVYTGAGGLMVTARHSGCREASWEAWMWNAMVRLL